MKKTTVPNPALYSNARDYFSVFVTTNKNQDSNFSYRFVAKKLKWPLAYLSDVVAGRKVLTLTRAIQFSSTYKLRSVDQERLTWFALVESENVDVKNFFYKKLHLAPEDILLPQIILKDQSMYNSLAAVAAILVVKRKLHSAREIMQLLKLPYLSEDKVKKALDEIKKNRYLVFDGSRNLIENRANFAFDNYNARSEEIFSNLKLHEETTQSFLEFIKYPQRPANYNTGLIHVRKDQFMSLALQIISLRNWLSEVSQENIRTATEDDQHRLMQYDLNLFPVSEMF